jgi:hypothetical protein
MSTITLDMLTTMIADAHPDASPQDAGTMLAKVITEIDAAYVAEASRKALVSAPPMQRTPKAPKVPAKVKPVNTLPNFAGKAMASDEGTRSDGQAKWLKENSKLSASDIKAISMVDASNYRALLSGRITAAQYNQLP